MIAGVRVLLSLPRGGRSNDPLDFIFMRMKGDFMLCTCPMASYPSPEFLMSELLGKRNGVSLVYCLDLDIYTTLVSIFCMSSLILFFSFLLGRKERRGKLGVQTT